MFIILQLIIPYYYIYINIIFFKLKSVIIQIMGIYIINNMDINLLL